MVFNAQVQQCLSILLGRIIGARNQIVKFYRTPVSRWWTLFLYEEEIELAHLKDSNRAQVIALLFYEQDIHS